MPLSTLSELRQSITDWTHSTSLTNALLNDMVSMVDARINAVLTKHPQMEASTSLSLTAGLSSVALPPGFLSVISVIEGDHDLIPLTETEIEVSQAQSTTPGEPTYYCISGGEVAVDRATDINRTLSIHYYRKLDLVADSSNWMLTNHPQVYLFGLMVEASRWLEAWERIPNYESSFLSELERVRIAGGERKSRTTLRVDNALLPQGRWDIASGTFR